MNFTNFSKLRAIIESIGVNYAARTEQRVKELWKGELIKGKKDVLVSSQGLFEILPDGSVVRVIVHAPQGPYQTRGHAEEKLMEDPENGWHKFHLLWCSTVGIWKNRLRKTNRDDGNFSYPLFWKDGTEFKPELRDGGRGLYLCKNCAGMLRKLGMHTEIKNFDVRGFLTTKELGGTFSNVNFVSDFDLIPNVYSGDWSQISRNFKEMRNWTCEKCFLNLSAHKNYLHAHHRDEHKANNSIFNLQALCIRCHANKHPNDARLNSSPDLRDFEKLFTRQAELQI